MAVTSTRLFGQYLSLSVEHSAGGHGIGLPEQSKNKPTSEVSPCAGSLRLEALALLFVVVLGRREVRRATFGSSHEQPRLVMIS